ncbi:MAG: hypothetical protein KGL39_10715 [Patescibacteria group bacterium]|nr:hypothetical protein [Patescibacteria group bacterium]
MAGAAASTGTDSGAVYRLPRVEMFATGVHDGETWTEADLHELADNFRRHKGKLDPPLVVGHEADQQLLDATDVPAAGWPDDLRVEYDPEDGEYKLVGSVEGVPPEVADWIRRGLYRKVSAEIYDHPSEAGLPGDGRVFRRLALLGGELPKVKILRRLPEPERARSLPFAETGGRSCLRFSEGGRPGKGLRRITFFSERRGNAMDRNQLAQAAIQLGIPQSAIDKLSDEELAAVTQTKAPAPPDGAVGGGNFADSMGAPGEGDDTAPMGTYAEDDLDADPTPNPQDDPANPRPAGVYAECGPPHGTRNFSDEAPRGDLPKVSPASVPAAPKEDLDRRTNGQVAKMYSETRRLHAETARMHTEIQNNFKTYQREIANRRKIDAEVARRNHGKSVHAFCERMKAEKKMLRAEADPKDPNSVYNRLLRTSPKKVHKFSEKGKQVAKSEYELQCAEIEARDPANLVRFFGEKMPQQPGQGGAMSPERRAQLLGATPFGQVVAKKLAGAK